MAANDVEIKVQELDGTWVTIGSARAAGITATDGSLQADQYGSSAANFTLKRNPRAMWPDIGAFTPIEVYVGGVLKWSGRVQETPTRDGDDRQMTLTCQGWQFHLDDDMYRKTYIETDLSQFVDTRTLLGCPLNDYVAAGSVTSDPNGGLPIICFPNQTVIASGNTVGMTLDMGTSSAWASYVVFAWDSVVTGDPSTAFVLRGHDDQNPLDGAHDTDVVFTMDSMAASGSASVSFSTQRRYVSFLISYSGTGGTYQEDQITRITSILISTDPTFTYASSGFSTLTASTIVADALDQATILLSSDQSLIASTSFFIPDFGLSNYTTPRDVITAANVYENYQPRVKVNKQFEYREHPVDSGVIMYQIDETGGAVFEDAAANSGDNIYSSVVVTATGPDGIPIVSLQSQPATVFTLSAVQLTNPGFESGTTGWTSNRTLTAATSQHDTGTHSGQIATTTIQNAIIENDTFTQSFTPGLSYRVTFSLRCDTTMYPTFLVAVLDASLGYLGSASLNSPATNTWTSYSLDFVAKSTGTVVFGLLELGTTSSGNVFLDTVQFFESSPTIVTKRGFKRTFLLDTNMSLTGAAAAQIGQVFLTQHITTPLKGSLTVSGDGIRYLHNGSTAHPSDLLLNTGEQILFSYLTDPDTGAVGRTGVIYDCTYDIIAGTSTVTIDNTRSNFDALLSRLQIVTGQVH